MNVCLLLLALMKHYLQMCYFQRYAVQKTSTNGPKTPAEKVREKIVRRAALEFKDGMYGILCKII